MAAASQVLSAVLLAGMLGMLGQGVRTVAGLKKMYDESRGRDAAATDLFNASRLLIGAAIGFLAGTAAALALGLDKLINLDPGSPSLLMGLAAAGYAGTDFIEAFASRVLPARAPGKAGRLPAPPSAAELERRISALREDVAEVRRPAREPAGGPAEATATVAEGADAPALVTVPLVGRMFPDTRAAAIARHLPIVLDGLRWAGLADRQMVLMALATIRAETEGFVPIDEGISRFNTARFPFDLYEPGTLPGQRLGNTEPGDGARFKGRGFVQLTGRDNYARIGPQVGTDLLLHPEWANEPGLAGRILAQFLRNHENTVRAALGRSDLRAARKAVNGGSHGLDRFVDAYERGNRALPAWPAALSAGDLAEDLAAGERAA